MTVSFDPVALLGELIRIPSADPPGGELEVARRVHAEMVRIGIAAELEEFQPGRANVVGRIPGRGEKPPLVFSSHMDTVPVGDQPWDFDPLAGDVVDDHVRGRGASDMKSALVAFLAAAEMLAGRDHPLAGDVILAFTAGESADCLGARRLVEQGFQAEIGAFLCGEPSSLDIIVAEKAILWLEAEAIGQMGHVSGAAGVNAIDLMMEFLTRLKGVELDVPAHPLLSPPSINVGRIAGGSAINVTPDRCTAGIDIRFGPDGNPDAVTSAVARVAPQGVRLRRIDFKPAVDEPPDSAFVGVCSAATAAETGRNPEIMGVSYYSDAAVLLDGLDVPFAILGPGTLGMSGQRHETIPAGNVMAAARIYARSPRNGCPEPRAISGPRPLIPAPNPALFHAGAGPGSYALPEQGE